MVKMKRALEMGPRKIRSLVPTAAGPASESSFKRVLEQEGLTQRADCERCHCK